MTTIDPGDQGKRWSSRNQKAMTSKHLNSLRLLTAGIAVIYGTSPEELVISENEEGRNGRIPEAVAKKGLIES